MKLRLGKCVLPCCLGFASVSWVFLAAGIWSKHAVQLSHQTLALVARHAEATIGRVKALSLLGRHDEARDDQMYAITMSQA